MEKGIIWINLQSHIDKTRIFYALQQARTSWLCLSEVFIRSLYRVEFEEITIDTLRQTAFNERDTDRLLDYYLAEKSKTEFKQEYGHLNFTEPQRNSEFPKRKRESNEG